MASNNQFLIILIFQHAVFCIIIITTMITMNDRKKYTIYKIFNIIWAPRFKNKFNLFVIYLMLKCQIFHDLYKQGYHIVNYY